MNFNIDEVLNKDENLQRGYSQYRDIEAKANEVATEISSTLIDSIVKDSEKFNITTAIMSVAKSLSHLTSYLYDNEEAFLTDVRKARESIPSDVIPALLRPEACGICDNCKNGNPQECINPIVRADYTTTRFLPLVANMLIEYDIFNKIMYMNVEGKENNDVASKEPKKEE